MLEKIHTSVPDEALIARVLEGELSAFELLMRRVNPALYKAGRAYGFNHQDVEDLMQEAHIRAYQGLAGFENRAAYKTWVIKILLRLCFQKRQKASFKNEVPQAALIPETAVPMFQSPPPADADHPILNRELGALIGQALNQLPLDYRLVFALRELNGLNGAETAAALEISEDNVKTRLSRAKALLRRQLEKIYRPEDVFEFNLVYCDRIVERVLERLDEGI